MATTAYTPAQRATLALLPPHLHSVARSMYALMAAGTDELQALQATHFGPNDARHRATVMRVLRDHGITL